MRWLPVILSLLWFAIPQSAEAKSWQTLKGCQLVAASSNDGDSFRVSQDGQEFVVRIYYADTPEVDGRFKDRIEAQAAYFGLTKDQAIQVGKMARDYTQQRLKNGFTVDTRWQGVYGGDRVTRKYGKVSVRGRDLAELLVSNGLARIHGMGIGGQTNEEVARLRELEAKAKTQKRGAWGIQKRR